MKVVIRFEANGRITTIPVDMEIGRHFSPVGGGIPGVVVLDNNMALSEPMRDAIQAQLDAGFVTGDVEKEGGLGEDALQWELHPRRLITQEGTVLYFLPHQARWVDGGTRAYPAASGQGLPAFGIDQPAGFRADPPIIGREVHG